MTPNSYAWIFQHPETLSAGLGRIVSDNPDLPALPELEEPTDLAMGYVYGLRLKFPHNELWEEPNGGADFLKAAIASTATNEFSAAFLLGVFAGSGDEMFFGEVVRRAKHRDGSTASLGVSVEAGAVLDPLAGIPEADHLFTAFSFNPHRIELGNFPNVAGTVVSLLPRDGALPALPPDAGTVGSIPDDFFARPGNPPPAREIQPNNPYAQGFQTVLLATLADLPEVIPVYAGPSVEFGPLYLSLTVTTELISRLTRAYRSLTLPAEGFAWADDTLDPLKGSALLCLDPQLVTALGLPVSHKPGDFSRYEDPLNTYPMQGVAVVVARIYQDGSGMYFPAIAEADGHERPLAGEWDLNVAKAQSCKRVAEMLKKAGL
jgi:hypothetical protein